MARLFPHPGWRQGEFNFTQGENMQKFFVLVVLLGLLALPVMAQDNPKFDVFGGYQYMHLSNVGGYSGLNVNLNGWDAAASAYFTKHIGVTGDFSGNYKSRTYDIDDFSGTVHTHVYSYAGGPVVSLNPGGTLNPFVHALFGGAHASLSACDAEGCESVGSQNGFVMMYGGGADVKMSKHMAVRGQLDWVYYRFNGYSNSSNVRVATGVVFHF